MPREPVYGMYPEGAPHKVQPVHVNCHGGAWPFDRCAEFHVYEQLAANGAAPERMVAVQRGIDGPNLVRGPCDNCGLMHANGFYGDAPLAGVDRVPVADVANGLGLLSDHLQAAMPQANANRAVHEHSSEAA